MTTDEETSAFLKQGLPDVDMAQFKRTEWEREPNTARITMRAPHDLLDACKAQAAERGVPYQRLTRKAIERSM